MHLHLKLRIVRVEQRRYSRQRQLLNSWVKAAFEVR